MGHKLYNRIIEGLMYMYRETNINKREFHVYFHD